MRLGIISDSHDHVWNLRAALAGLAATDALICCGDCCSPFIIGIIGEGYAGRPIHIVFGNNDGDLFRITQNAARFPQITLHGELFIGEFAGRRVLANHYPTIARQALSGEYDLVCYGHDHLRANERHGDTLLINPGTLHGYEPSGKRDGPVTFATYDTVSGQADFFEVVREDDERTILPLALVGNV